MTDTDETPAHFAALTLPFGEGEHKFLLDWKHSNQWEEITGLSLFATFRAMVSGQYAPIRCYREIIRLGLIGAGMTPVDALKKVEFYVEGRPISESHMTSLAIAGAALFGSDGMAAAIGSA